MRDSCLGRSEYVKLAVFIRVSIVVVRSAESPYVNSTTPFTCPTDPEN